MVELGPRSVEDGEGISCSTESWGRRPISRSSCARVGDSSAYSRIAEEDAIRLIPQGVLEASEVALYAR